MRITELERDQTLVKLLKLEILTELIFKTDKGEISRNLRKDSNEYFYTLDGVELDKETSNNVKVILNK